MKIVAFGDSITEGKTGVAPEDNWLLKLDELLEHKHTLINSGHGGNSAREAMDRYEKDVLAHNPDIVLLEFGGNNDDPRPERAYRKVTDEEFIHLLEKFRIGLPEKCKVVVITFPPIIDEQHIFYNMVPNGKLDEGADKHRQIVRKFAADNGYVLLDLYKLIYPRRYELILPDGIHLNPDGHTFFAEQTAEILQKSKLI